MSLLEHSVFTMVLQALALGLVCGFRRLPPRLATWICTLSILAFTLSWSQLGTWLGQFMSQGDIAVFSLAGARPVSAVTACIIGGCLSDCQYCDRRRRLRGQANTDGLREAHPRLGELAHVH